MLQFLVKKMHIEFDIGIHWKSIDFIASLVFVAIEILSLGWRHHSNFSFSMCRLVFSLPLSLVSSLVCIAKRFWPHDECQLPYCSGADHTATPLSPMPMAFYYVRRINFCDYCTAHFTANLLNIKMAMILRVFPSIFNFHNCNLKMWTFYSKAATPNQLVNTHFVFSYRISSLIFITNSPLHIDWIPSSCVRVWNKKMSLHFWLNLFCMLLLYLLFLCHRQPIPLTQSHR